MRKLFQFKISLEGIKPLIWRRIQISDLCTFWSLHVAIQDAMGWLDYHLHEFTLINPKTEDEIRMGIPFEDDFDDMNPEASWMFKAAPFLGNNKIFTYVYDFGDNWRHKIEFEGKGYLTWVGGAYDPDEFKANKVKFTSPSARLNLLLEDEELN